MLPAAVLAADAVVVVAPERDTDTAWRRLDLLLTEVAAVCHGA